MISNITDSAYYTQMVTYKGMPYALDDVHNSDDVNEMGKIVLRCFDTLGDVTQKH